MITKIAQFEVRPGKRREVMEAIEKFTRTVHVSEPGSIFYVSLQDKKNENLFIHVMAFQNAGAEMVHKNAGYTREFLQVLDRACKKAPQFTEYNCVGGI